MASTLEQIYIAAKERFKLTLVAGASGMTSPLSWVHLVESTELISFLKRSELVIVTGVRTRGTRKLLDFARQLKENDAAGLIVNKGPYIPEVPRELIDYCEELNFPLFTLPWETRLVEFCHDTCKMIFMEENTEENLTGAFIDAMLFPEKQKECLNTLARNGFSAGTVFRLFAFKAEGGPTDLLPKVIGDLQFQMERILNRINRHYFLFVQNNILYAATADYTQTETDQLLQSVEELHPSHGFQYFCAVNPATDNFSRTAHYYDISGTLLRLAVKRNTKITFYEDLEVYKLLLSISNLDVLREFCDKVLGSLKNYDRLNQTDSFSLLRQYFEYQGCIQDIAAANFVHRNTIRYQLGKIEKILGLSLENWDDRVKIQLCLLAEDIL